MMWSAQDTVPLPTTEGARTQYVDPLNGARKACFGRLIFDVKCSIKKDKNQCDKSHGIK